MKKLLVLALASLICLQASAQTVPQKCGYVNTETILSAIPEYKVATDKLEALGKQYQEAVKKDFSEIETLYNNYQKQKASLSAAQRQAKEEQIISKEKGNGRWAKSRGLERLEGHKEGVESSLRS